MGIAPKMLRLSLKVCLGCLIQTLNNAEEDNAAILYFANRTLAAQGDGAASLFENAALIAPTLVKLSFQNGNSGWVLSFDKLNTCFVFSFYFCLRSGFIVKELLVQLAPYVPPSDLLDCYDEQIDEYIQRAASREQLPPLQDALAALMEIASKISTYIDHVRTDRRTFQVRWNSKSYYCPCHLRCAQLPQLPLQPHSFSTLSYNASNKQFIVENAIETKTDLAIEYAIFVMDLTVGMSFQGNRGKLCLHEDISV